MTTAYLIDTQNPTGYAQVIDELVNGSVTRTYAYGLQRISQNQVISGNWTPSFYGYDAHGNVRYLTSAASTVTDTYQYDAFGNLIASTGSTPNNYRFSSEPFDPALGMYQMRARWYRQAAGRFASRDPLDGVCCTPLSWDPYMYSLQNPVNNSDPTGRATLAAPPPVTAPPSVRGADGVVLEYAFVLATVASAAKIGGAVIGDTIQCGAEYYGSKVIALVEGGPITRVARCRVTAGPNTMPHKPRPGAVPWEFNPDDVRTDPDSGWDCNPALTECTKRCDNGNTSYLHFDDGIKFNEGRHWDYKDCNGKPWKIWPDGTMTPA